MCFCCAFAYYYNIDIKFPQPRYLSIPLIRVIFSLLKLLLQWSENRLWLTSSSCPLCIFTTMFAVVVFSSITWFQANSLNFICFFVILKNPPIFDPIFICKKFMGNFTWLEALLQLLITFSNVNNLFQKFYHIIPWITAAETSAEICNEP